MDKIPTLFLRDPQNMQMVTQEVNPDAAWVLEGYGVPTIKKDGTNIRVTIKNGQVTQIEKRRNPTRQEKAAGAEPGYVPANRDDPSDQHIIAAVDAEDVTSWPDGAWPCEALGPKIQGGIEQATPGLYPFSFEPIILLDFPEEVTFFMIRDYLALRTIEGIVWHDWERGRFAKIKRRDFGLSWPPRM